MKVSASQVNLDYYLNSYSDRRRMSTKIGHIVIAIFKEARFLVTMIVPLVQNLNPKWRKIEYAPVIHKEEKLSYDISKLSYRIDPSPQSDGLCLLIQGLGGYPFIWKKYIDILKKENPRLHCVAPVVYKKGNYHFKTVAKPILPIIQDYIAKNPGKPISLVGISNGARIAAFLERKLKNEKTPIKTISIAGVHFGTRLMDRAIKTGFTKVFMVHPEVQREMRFAAEPNIRRLEAWRSCAIETKGIRERDFFASTEDGRVDLRSSIPKINPQTDSKHILHKESHISIMDGARNPVVKSVLDFTKRHKSTAPN